VDVLGAVLREARFESVAYRWLDLRAPFRLSFDQPGVRGIHIVARGSCELLLDERPALRLETGDLVLCPRADPHLLCSVGDRRAPVVSGFDLARRTAGTRLRAGGTGDETVIICGAFLFHDHAHPALSGLPRIVHVSGERTRWLAMYVEAIAAEAFEPGPGSDVVMARLSDALVARALRFHIEQTDEPGWLSGLADPAVAAALAALHDDPGRDWTVATLATTVGLSRAAFAARFARRVGQTPMRYLLHLRMRRAMTLLREDHATVASVAARVGYGSEAALTAAFKRHTGVTPGAYRRTGTSGRHDHHVTAETASGAAGA
jgi:AraC-like DNA-binding protein